MPRFLKTLLATIAIPGCFAGALVICAYAGERPAAKPAPAAVAPSDGAMLFRLDGDQYRNSIADIFGADINVAGRFDPQTREDGLLALGDARGTVSPSGAEQFLSMARSISAQVIDDKHRGKLVPCKPADPKAMDEACATQFYAKYGRLLYRRPLTPAELRTEVKLTKLAVGKLGDFYAGLQYGLVSLLVSPDFLFVHGVPDRAGGHEYLDDYGKAARLSFLLWNTTPDDELLTAAEHGELSTQAGRTRQVSRLLNSPRLEAGVRAFFTDMLDLDAAAQTEMDPVIYPQFTTPVASQSKEETLRTVVDLLLTRHGDYRDIFTTRRTFITRALGAVYHVPVDADDGWAPYEFPAEAQRVGIESQISFLSPHSHPGVSSPTRRGKAVRELLLCQIVPPMPNGIDFSRFQNADLSRYHTARERLEIHRTNAACAGCHRITDPIGLGLEPFDGAGTPRSQENGAPIDPSGTLDGIAYTDVPGLGRALHDNPQAVSCVVNRVYSYGLRRAIDPPDRADLDAYVKQFAADGYVFPRLLELIANSDSFYRAGPRPAATSLAQNGH